MRIRLFAWLLPIIIGSCKNEQVTEKIPVIEVNPTELNQEDILELTDTILVDHLVLPDSIEAGRIRQIKQYGEDLFLLSRGEHTSLLIFRGINFVDQFDRFGEGPGQYQSINSFLINIGRKEIVIHDPLQRAILIYDLDSHDLKEKRRVNAVFTNIEMVGSDHFLLIADVEGEGTLNYLQVTNYNGDSMDVHLATHYPLVRQAHLPNHFTESGSDIYFSEPFTEMVYKISSAKIEPHIRIDFGDHKFSEKYWQSEDFELIEEKLFGSPHAFTAHLYSETEKEVRFFYMWGAMEPRLVVYDLKAEEVQNIPVSKGMLVDGMLPYPAGYAAGFYSQVFYSTELDLEEHPFWQKQVTSSENETLVWVRYKVK